MSNALPNIPGSIAGEFVSMEAVLYQLLGAHEWDVDYVASAKIVSIYFKGFDWLTRYRGSRDANFENLRVPRSSLSGNLGTAFVQLEGRLDAFRMASIAPVSGSESVVQELAHHASANVAGEMVKVLLDRQLWNSCSQWPSVATELAAQAVELFHAVNDAFFRVEMRELLLVEEQVHALAAERWSGLAASGSADSDDCAPSLSAASQESDWTARSHFPEMKPSTVWPATKDSPFHQWWLSAGSTEAEAAAGVEQMVADLLLDPQDQA